MSAPLRIQALVAMGMLLALEAHAAHPDSVAKYRVRMDPNTRRLNVSAQLPIAGDRLRMDTTRPAGIPELDSLGWAGLIHDLRVVNASGRDVQVARARARGWTLQRPDSTVLTLEYQIDYGPLERMGWPAPREAAYRDDQSFVVVGRSLFVTTEATRECQVTFELPDGWSSTTPWRTLDNGRSFTTGTTDELVENLVVLSRGSHEVLTAAGLHLHVFAFGHWRAELPQVRDALGSIARHHVELMKSGGKKSYVVVLLPELERGGESYRSSFALNTDQPGPSGVPTWTNLVAHEMFHLWNGWMLRGADYTSSQWFQEGFTEYVANRAIASSGLVDETWFRNKLATHIETSRQLTTTLENIGTRKGPPLYSAGALVALAWDLRIRAATGGKRDLGDFFRELMRRTDDGSRAYAWADLRASLNSVVPADWEGFYEAHIRGDRPLPVAEVLAEVGQLVIEGSDGVKVEADPAAAATAKRRWAEFVSRR